MSDVTITLGTQGKDIVLGAFKDISAAAQKMGKSGFGDLIAPIAKVTAAVGSVGAIMGGIKGALDLGSEMVDLSNRTGIAVENLMGLRRGFKDAGVDAAALGPAVNKMQKSLASAVGGGKEADVLKSLGLDPQSLASADPGKAFADIGNAIAALPNSTERAAASIALFGKSGAELLQVFMDPNFKEAGNVSNAARLLGENAGVFDKASDALGHVGGKLQGLFIGMADGSADFLNQLADGIDGIDLTNLGKGLGNVIGNFSTDWKSEVKKIEALTLQLTALAFSPQLIKPLAAELLIAAREFGKELEANIPGAAKAIAGFQNLVASTTTSMFNGSAYSAKQAEYESLAKNEKDPRKKKLYQDEADRLQKLIDVSPSFRDQGIDYSTAGNEQFDKIKKAGDSEIDQLLKKISEIADKTGAFQATPLTKDANAAARNENATRVIPNDAYNPVAIGMGAKPSIVADSLAAIGGGGGFFNSNPLLDIQRQALVEQKAQTAYLKGINDRFGASAKLA